MCLVFSRKILNPAVEFAQDIYRRRFKESTKLKPRYQQSLYRNMHESHLYELLIDCINKCSLEGPSSYHIEKIRAHTIIIIGACIVSRVCSS